MHPALSRLLDKPALDDPAERDAFKQQRPGIRSDFNDAELIKLPSVDLDEAVYQQRRSHRTFSLKPIAQDQLSRFLSCLSSLQTKNKFKYR